jgi:GntR family transcriptional regulator/MocR family aminotransferase
VGASPAACSGGVLEGRIGRPDPTLFPMVRWRALLRGAVDRLAATPGAQHAAGGVRLRQAIARWLSASRGLAVAPEQIILVSGRQQALRIAADLLLRRHARAVLEDPCDGLTACTYAEADAVLVNAPVDAHGLCPDALPEGPAALLHVTPEHQRPTGAVLSAERRAAVLGWAAQAGAVVVEESCDAELRYAAMEAPPLMSLDQTERVIHIGGFATGLGPWVTAGYMAVPRPLISAAQQARRMLDDSAPSLESVALAELLEGGGYARHLHRLRKAYMARRDTLIGALHRNFGPVTTRGADAGLHLAWQIAPDLGDAAQIADTAEHCGLEAAALQAGTEPTVLLGFGMLSERQLETGIAQAAMAIANGRRGLVRRAN